MSIFTKFLTIIVLLKVSDVQNEYILHEAVIKNDVEAVREIMKEPVDVNMRNNVSNFSLIIICVRLAQTPVTWWKVNKIWNAF